jgi:hypothetical protein
MKIVFLKIRDKMSRFQLLLSLKLINPSESKVYLRPGDDVDVGEGLQQVVGRGRDEIRVSEISLITLSITEALKQSFFSPCLFLIKLEKYNFGKLS